MKLNNWGRNVGEEARKNFSFWLENGFYERYLAGDHVLDIGFDGYIENVTPITPSAIGVGIDYPGYDGITLPFPDGSQDAVFASHCLEHIDNYRAVLADWFRVLRVGGHMIIAVPHQYLYERKLTLPSRFNMDHRRFYTPGSLLREIEEAIDPMHYRLRLLIDNDRDFDYSIEPETHAGGCYEILLVIEKIDLPYYAKTVEAAPKIRTIPAGTFTHLMRPDAHNPVVAINSSGSPQSVIIFKMDHLGDFILAQPALRNIRLALPDAHLTLVCGSWNASAAREQNVVDEVIEFSLFERNAVLNAVTSLADRMKTFEKLIEGRRFDLAIDLRVDGDTREILEHVPASVRAGFGRKKDFPFLDIALPVLSPTTGGRAHQQFCEASRFSAVHGVNRGYEISVPEGHYPRGANVIYGPYIGVMPSRYKIRLLVEDDYGEVPACDYDIVCDGGTRKLGEGPCEEIAGDGIWIDIDDQIDDLEIRINGRGEDTPQFTFRGCSLWKVGQMDGPHQSELMAMLVALVSSRSNGLPVEEQLA